MEIFFWTERIKDAMIAAMVTIPFLITLKLFGPNVQKVIVSRSYLGTHFHVLMLHHTVRGLDSPPFAGLLTRAAHFLAGSEVDGAGAGGVGAVSVDMAAPPNALTVLNAFPGSGEGAVGVLSCESGLGRHRHSLDVLDDLQSDVLQAPPQLGHLGAQRSHAAQDLVQLPPELQLLLGGQALNHGLHRRQRLLLRLHFCRRTRPLRHFYKRESNQAANCR